MIYFTYRDLQYVLNSRVVNEISFEIPQTKDVNETNRIVFTSTVQEVIQKIKMQPLNNNSNKLKMGLLTDLSCYLWQNNTRPF